MDSHQIPSITPLLPTEPEAERGVPDEARRALQAALWECKRVVVGQDAMLERVLVALLAGGHVLLEGVPGLAKTLTVRTLADVLGGSFNRVQFTPDLVPADLVGTRIWQPDHGEFRTELGPVFANLLLADEINRAPAKVQSALLEVMQERQVTIGGTTYEVPSPFLVLATQNPIESEGTYPLPEAQLDRFLFKLTVDYPRSRTRSPSCSSGPAPSVAAEEVLRGEDLLRYREAAARRPRRPAGRDLRGAPRRRDPQPRRARAGGHRAAHRVRGEPARVDRPDPGRAGAGDAARARRTSPPPTSTTSPPTCCATGSCFLRRARRRRQARGPARPRARRRGPARQGAARRGRVSAAELIVPPGPPGPGALPADAVARLDLALRRRVGGRPARRPPHRRSRRRHRDRAAAAVRAGRRRAPARPRGERPHRTPHVRLQVPERAITTWLVLDVSASMAFGTADRLKSDVTEGVAEVVSRLAVRRGGRIGVVVAGAEKVRLLPPRGGARRARRGRAGSCSPASCPTAPPRAPGSRTR